MLNYIPHVIDKKWKNWEPWQCHDLGLCWCQWARTASHHLWNYEFCNFQILQGKVDVHEHNLKRRWVLQQSHNQWNTQRTWSQGTITIRKWRTVLRTHCYNNSLKWIVKGLSSSHLKFLISKSGISPVSFQTVLDNYVSNCSFVTTYSAPIVPSLMTWQCFQVFLAFSTNADCSSFERELNLLCQKSYMT